MLSLACIWRPCEIQWKSLTRLNLEQDTRCQDRDDVIDAIVVDEEAIGYESRGSGAKILYGKGALDSYLSQQKSKDLELQTTVEGSNGEGEVETEFLPSVVASM